MKTDQSIPLDIKVVAYAFLVLGMLFIWGPYNSYILGSPKFSTTFAIVNIFIALIHFKASYSLFKLDPFWRLLCKFYLYIPIFLILFTFIVGLMHTLVMIPTALFGNTSALQYFQLKNWIMMCFSAIVFYLIYRFLCFCIVVLERDDIRTLFEPHSPEKVQEL